VHSEAAGFAQLRKNLSPARNTAWEQLALAVLRPAGRKYFLPRTVAPAVRLPGRSGRKLFQDGRQEHNQQCDEERSQRQVHQLAPNVERINSKCPLRWEAGAH